jgi:hypothetical protein
LVPGSILILGKIRKWARLPYSPTFREYGTARMLLAGDAEAREVEYIADDPYTRP